MTFLASLDPKDRRFLLWSVGIAMGLAVILGLLMPRENDDDNPVPSSYLATRHGARAAYETLLRSGYQIQRWERPISDLAATAGPDTVVIFADPASRDAEAMKAVRQIVERGGRVLATGPLGGFILPGGMPETPKDVTFAACQLEPEGLDPLAGSGAVWMVPGSTWRVGNPNHRIEYSCGGHPAVVEYDWGKGHVVWWAGATPLENGSLARADNLNLLLNSIGPAQGHQFYWDESLHGVVRSAWSYAGGTALNLLRIGLPVLGLLIVFSFSRRRGPVRDLAQPVRTRPIEFLEALGSLYQSAGAAATALTVAWERFRRRTLRLCGMKPGLMAAGELSAAIRRRFPAASPHLEETLAACEEATWSETLDPRQALKLVQKLHDLEQDVARMPVSGVQAVKSAGYDSRKQERAS